MWGYKTVLLVVTFNNLVHCEVTGEWRKLHNEELHDLYSSPTIVRVIKSREIFAVVVILLLG
jgi:hypothetical protein